MRYYALLLLFPTMAFADTPIDMGAFMANALKLASSVGGIPGAVILAAIMLGYGIYQIASYFTNRDQRERDAYNLQMKIQKQQDDNLARMQRDAVASLMTSMDQKYQQDYQIILAEIQAKDYPSVYLKFAPQFREPVAQFLYDETLTPEFRAGRVIQVVRNA